MGELFGFLLLLLLTWCLQIVSRSPHPVVMLNWLNCIVCLYSKDTKTSDKKKQLPFLHTIVTCLTLYFGLNPATDVS
jgi:hypothetical protein